MTKCDEQLLLEFSTEFLGYGALDTPLWLIGGEAGGGATVDEVSKRASVWKRRGQRETEDLQGYHAKLELPTECDWSRKIESTWGALIRVILALDGKAIVDRKDVLEFQRHELGRSGGNNCVLDLSQLSCPGLATWKFHECGISWLDTREIYERRILPLRCKLIRERLACHKPRRVLFYGIGHRSWWECMAQSKFSASPVTGLSWVRHENTLFALMPHPKSIFLAGKGAVNAFLAEIGAALGKELH